MMMSERDSSTHSVVMPPQRENFNLLGFNKLIHDAKNNLTCQRRPNIIQLGGRFLDFYYCCLPPSSSSALVLHICHLMG